MTLNSIVRHRPSMLTLDTYFILFACMVVGTGVHIFIPRLLRASTIAALICGVLCTVVAMIHEGIQRMMLLFIVYGAYGWVFSFVVGLPFYLVRKWTSRH